MYCLMIETYLLLFGIIFCFIASNIALIIFVDELFSTRKVYISSLRSMFDDRNFLFFRCNFANMAYLLHRTAYQDLKLPSQARRVGFMAPIAQ